jgi:hypothetical protein
MKIIRKIIALILSPVWGYLLGNAYAIMFFLGGLLFFFIPCLLYTFFSGLLGFQDGLAAAMRQTGTRSGSWAILSFAFNNDVKFTGFLAIIFGIFGFVRGVWITIYDAFTLDYPLQEIPYHFEKIKNEIKDLNKSTGDS